MVAEKATEPMQPTEAEQDDAIRADVALQRLERQAGVTNPALERMEVRR